MLITKTQLKKIIRNSLHEVIKKRALGVSDNLSSDMKFDASNLNTVSNYSPTGKTGPINSGAKLTQTIINAWEWTSPFMPKGARITSGVRTGADQLRIINNYAKKNGIPDSDTTETKLKKLRAKGYKIGAPKKGTTYSGHSSGRTFDISGASLDQIYSAMKWVTDNENIPVKFVATGEKGGSIIERTNNAVHAVVDIKMTGSKENYKVAGSIESLNKETLETELKKFNNEGSK